jgi:hypothetical protein
MKAILWTAMTAVAAFALTIGSAQANGPDYNVKQVTLRGEHGELKPAVTFTSPIDGKSYFIALEAWKQAIRDGKALARFYAQRGEKPSGEQMRKMATERAAQIYGNDRVFVDFYKETVVGAAILDIEGITDPNT